MLILPLETKHHADAIADRLRVETLVERYRWAIQVERGGVVEFTAADGFHPECVSVGAGVHVALLRQLKREGIIEAFQEHEDALTDLRFPEYYYDGPFVRVENPDTDLPRRLDGGAVDDRTRQDVEGSGVFDGERLVAPFRDANSLGEIVGGLLVAAEYPTGWDEEERYVYPTIQGSLRETLDRLHKKASRSRGQRAEAIKAAVVAVEEAAAAFGRAHYATGEQALQRALTLLEGAGRPKRRRAAIPLGSGGQHGAE